MERKPAVRPLLLDFHEKATLDDVLEAVKIVYESTGCNPCGRLSLFLKADELVDPPIERLRGIGSLRGIQELGPEVAVRSSAAGG
jgi:hypothetical protein